ncbi:hypothetical protein FLL45_08770 [Aliikangiella marina]|uniref:Uncharacterized protein n=1 Tax=Aliikangiella marina TaxID=1712262 RepID=A0A545TCS8_9GAMM|nr:hypothetical protein [Aliikangiella marina]TQV75024.1 hypothetical protein FLL45_08770 [Aliikangiella marina]
MQGWISHNVCSRCDRLASHDVGLAIYMTGIIKSVTDKRKGGSLTMFVLDVIDWLVMMLV